MKFDPLNAITDLSIEISVDKYRYIYEIEIYTYTFQGVPKPAKRCNVYCMSLVCLGASSLQDVLVSPHLGDVQSPQLAPFDVEE